MTGDKYLSEAKDVVEDVLAGYLAQPVNLLGIDDAEGEFNYLSERLEGYVKSVQEILKRFDGVDRSGITILEIGAYLGLVSISLAKLGFRVTATDIEEFSSCTGLIKKYKANGVSSVSCNLRIYRLPFPDEEFDAVILCESLEHLNFNPLPVIKEVNRVMKLGGFLYLTVPNIARLENRIKLLKGQSIHNPVKDFFTQLDPADNMIVGLHWREYTAPEIAEMLEAMEFEITGQEYRTFEAVSTPRTDIKQVIIKLARLIISIPPVRRLLFASLLNSDMDSTLRNNQITCARKAKVCKRNFHFTNATHNDY